MLICKFLGKFSKVMIARFLYCTGLVATELTALAQRAVNVDMSIYAVEPTCVSAAHHVNQL